MKPKTLGQVWALATLSLFLNACGNDTAQSSSAENIPPPLERAPETVKEKAVSDLRKKETQDTPEVSITLEVRNHNPAPRLGDNRKLTAPEAKWVGSLVASDVSSDHLTSGGFMLKTKGSGDMVQDVMDAMEEEGGGFTEAGGCIWLELYDDHTGFWWTCSMMESASVTYGIDYFTGEHINTGFMFDWEIKNGKLSIVLEKNLEFKKMEQGNKVAVRTNEWEIRIPSAPSAAFSASDYFPAEKYTLPKKTRWEFFSKHQFGKPYKHKAQTFF